MSKRKKRPKKKAKMQTNPILPQVTSQQYQQLGDAQQPQSPTSNDLYSPTDTEDVTLNSNSQKKWYQTASEWVVIIFNFLTTIAESVVILIALYIVILYLINGVILHDKTYLDRIYGFIKFLDEYWKGALLVFPLFFIKTFLRKRKNLTRASAAGVELESKEESPSLSA